MVTLLRMIQQDCFQPISAQDFDGNLNTAVEILPTSVFHLTEVFSSPVQMDGPVGLISCFQVWVALLGR